MLLRLSHPFAFAWLRRCAAVAGVAIVALLSWCAVDPQAHEFLHREAAPGETHRCEHHHHTPATAEDHHCVVTDFERGASDGLLAAPLMRLVTALVVERLTLASLEAPVRGLRGWLPCAHAPPARD